MPVQRISCVRNTVSFFRRRHPLAFAPCVVLASVLIAPLTGCSSSSGPPPAVSMIQATGLGIIPANPDILGRDGAYSAVFNGYSVWLYGDTFLASPNADGFSLISDSWSFTSDLRVQDGISGFQERLDSAGAPSMILQFTPAEQAYNQDHNGNPCQEQPCGQRWALWPASIITDPNSNQALVFYMVVNAQPGSFNFQGYGSSVAIWEDFQNVPQRPTFNPPIVADHPDLMFNQQQPNFGTASLINNGTLYVYGCGTPNNGADKGCRLAKVAPANAQSPSAWSYYAGNANWSSQIGDSIPVFNGSSIVSVAWNAFLQQYIAIYSLPFSQNVIMRTAPNPEGPWSSEITAFVAMQPAQGNVYDAHQHAEYDANGGQTIYVTYSRATGTFTSEIRLVALQLQKIG
jgi:Domain of unknown function (DUF4185)